MEARLAMVEVNFFKPVVDRQLRVVLQYIFIKLFSEDL